MFVKAYLIGWSNPFPDVNSFDKIEIGKGKEDLADDVMPVGRSIQILNFEHQRSLQHFSVGKLVGKTLIEDRILGFALYWCLTSISLIRQQIHTNVPLKINEPFYRIMLYLLMCFSYIEQTA